MYKKITKIICAIAIVTGLFLVAGAKYYGHIDGVIEAGDRTQLVGAGARETHSVALETGVVATTTGFMLVDLSDATVYPHTNVTVIDVLSLDVVVDCNLFTGDVEIGFVTDVNASEGDFEKVWCWHFIAGVASDAHIEKYHGDFTFSPVVLSLTYTLADRDADDTTFQTDVALAEPGAGTGMSGAGDMAMKITRTAGTAAACVRVAYRTR